MQDIHCDETAFIQTSTAGAWRITARTAGAGAHVRRSGDYQDADARLSSHCVAHTAQASPHARRDATAVWSHTLRGRRLTANHVSPDFRSGHLSGGWAGRYAKDHRLRLKHSAERDRL